ncbi:integrin beta-8 isoform X4 [Notamacropus eugenii]|uniref:integrin beta-8 isoform X4 n=1 Tax=Notamacropus eugenii TaxID=9315 RepID=UPI003B66CDA4
MWGSALALWTAAGMVCLQKGRRAPGPVLGAACLFSMAFGLGQSGEENRCTSSNAATCSKCLVLGPECGWCAQEDFMAGAAASERCDIVSNLVSKGCLSDFIESPSIGVTIPTGGEANTQVSPGEVLIQLRPGAEASFMMKVHPLQKYPVDLYYLVDVSASMHNNIEKLNSVGNDLSQKMASFSHDFRLGFGSYVDKTVSPYISIHPGRIHNQCSDYNLDCMPPHGYIHVLSLTENITEFERAVDRQKISGNIDTPEGGFDAMLQAAVCQSHIGWRKEAKRLLLVMTDQTSHLALDSKLAGIVVPNDGKCHLKDNVYIKSTSMEHPSLGQLAEKLTDNNINVIFAVQGKQFHWYKDLLPLLPGTVAGQIESTAANLNNLVVDAYQVLFNITVTMDGCDGADGRSYTTIKPIGYNESTKVHIYRKCSCQCDDGRSPNRKCVDETLLGPTCPQCDGDKCHFDGDKSHLDSCKAQKNQPICSGQGVCICGKCFCHKTKLGKVYGKYCEMDDFSCPYHHGNLCAGHGECEGGRCKCFRGWEGDRCQCPSSPAQNCVNSKGQICSGRGACVCGKCECTDPRIVGRLCEYCPTCDAACDENQSCVQCYHPHNLSQALVDQCRASCPPRAYYIDQIEDCFSNPSHFRIFFIISIITFLIGLLKVLIIRQIILQRTRNKVKSASYRVSTSKKDKMFLPAVCTHTVTYRRDKPEEINIDISKLHPHETFKCNF